MVQQAKKEIPWCTVCLVTGALVAHTLVLVGNISTAKAFKTLGESTGGWSDVGQDLSGALHNELDRIMTDVTQVMTKAVGTLETVHTGVDSVLGLAGAVTDTSLDAWEKGFNQSRSASLVQAATKGSPSMPKVGSESDLRKTVISSSAGALVEEEVFFMGQIGKPVVTPESEVVQASGIHHSRATSDLLPVLHVGDEVPSFNIASVEALTTHTMAGVLTIWHTARAEAVALGQMSNASVSAFPDPGEFKASLKIMIANVVNKLTGTASVALDKLFEIIKPALLQIGKWVLSFGTKVTDKLESFMTSLDNVQKIFDQIMNQLNPGSGKGKADMIHETYTLFDASNSGYISVQDLKDVGEIYGINALAGSKAEDLFKEYDTDGNGKIMRDEFDLLVDDPNVPNIMATVLRYYAKKLSSTAGVVAGARYRDEVAQSVVEYLKLVCAKNKTKVGWVSTTLTNRSLPPAFSADVLVQIAQNMDNPDQLTKADVGLIITKEMLRQNTHYVGQLLALTEDMTYWTNEGYDPADQPKVVERLSRWIANTPYASQAFAAQKATVIVNGTVPKEGDTVFLQALQASASVQLTSAQIMAMPRALHQAATDRVKIYHRSRVIAKRMAVLSRPVTPTVSVLQLSLGGTRSGVDPMAEASLHKGVKAVPETLQFAEFLANNATATADRFVKMCFDYTSESSSPLDSFAVQLKNMIKKVQNFISLMQEYSGEKGIERLHDEISSFTTNAANDMLGIINKSIDEKIDKFLDKHNLTRMPSAVEERIRNYYTKFLPLPQVNSSKAPSLVQEEAELKILTDADGDVDKPKTANEIINSLHLGSAWSTLQYTLSLLSSSLPTVIDDLKYARKEVSSVSKTLDSIFATFKSKGPKIFDLVSKLYKIVWIAYYILFGTLTASILLYGFWASGFLGGPKAAASTEGEEWYERPQGFRDRCRICCSCCDSCLRGCHDSHLCFWSWIILFQIIVLILFLVSIVLCLLAGIKAFISAGCAEVYLLGDSAICAGTLGTVRQFLVSFLTQGGLDLSVACEEKTLLTCQLIGKKLKSSAILTVIGSLIAAVFSFQLVVESAILHERARWRRIFDEESKRVS